MKKIIDETEVMSAAKSARGSCAVAAYVDSCLARKKAKSDKEEVWSQGTCSGTVLCADEGA